MSLTLTPPSPLWSVVDRLYSTHALDVVREWWASDAWGLLLLGGVGRGKSQAAAWAWQQMDRADYRLACEQCRPRRDVLWLRARVLQRLSWDERARLIDRCASAPGLVVDELGGEDERTGQALGDVLEQRGDEQRRTVMTTNLAPSWTEVIEFGETVRVPGFLQRYGDRLVSRLRAGGVDGGKARWAAVVRGDDLRGVEVKRDEKPATVEAEEPLATAEFMDEVLREAAPGVAEMLAPIVEAQRAAGSEG